MISRTPSTFGHQTPQLSKICLFILLNCVSTFAAASMLLKTYNQDLYTLTTKAYNSVGEDDITLTDKLPAKKIVTISQLNTILEQHYKDDSYLMAAKILAGKQTLINRNINHNSVNKILGLLLKNDEIGLAKQITDSILKTGNGRTRSKMHYLLAIYHFDQKDIEQSQTHLTQIEYQDALSKKERDYATLLFGITLQKMKQHRAAIKHYSNIDIESPYYSYAQLNKATAYIRQGWWTDAQIAIDNSINRNTSNNYTELTNRLFLVLGYSQLKHEFYRDARNSFRQLSLDSQYKNRALLGIGLSALNQGDFIGALNAFDTLKSSGDIDISTTEAYLLAAYTHDQFNQTATAASLYTQAIEYYQNRINTTRNYNTITPLIQDNHILALIQKKIERIAYIIDNISDNSLQAELSTLLQRYQSLIDDEKDKITENNIKILTSYLSQAQFGQAKIYDHAQ